MSRQARNPFTAEPFLSLPPFPDVLFAREGGKPTCRTSEILEVRKKAGEKKNRAKKAWRPPSCFQSPTTLPSLLPSCCSAFIFAFLQKLRLLPLSLSLSLSTNLTVGRAPYISHLPHCSDGRGSGAKTRICLFCGRN